MGREGNGNVGNIAMNDINKEYLQMDTQRPSDVFDFIPEDQQNGGAGH